MIAKPTPSEEAEFFNLELAKWVISVLSMLISVVGRESLLGLILRQTRSEIASLVRDETATPTQPNEQWFRNN